MTLRSRAFKFIIGLCFVVVLPLVPTPAMALTLGPCPPTQEGQVTIVGGRAYFCFCLISVLTGRKYCHWVDRYTFRAGDDVGISAEWGQDAAVNYAQVTQDPNTGAFSSLGEVDFYRNGTLTNRPAGWEAVANTLWRWNGSSWAKVYDSGFGYSQGSWAWTYMQASWASPPGGAGYFAQNTYGFVWDGAQWRGNAAGTWSGYTYWDLGYAAASAPPTAPPPSVVKKPPRPPGPRSAMTSALGSDVIGGG